MTSVHLCGTLWRTIPAKLILKEARSIKITIQLTDDAYQVFKALAAQNGQDPAQLVVEWITQKEGEARVDQLFANDPEWNPTQALDELAAGQGEHFGSTEELFPRWRNVHMPTHDLVPSFLRDWDNLT